MWPVCLTLQSVTVTRGLNMPRTYNTAALNVKNEDHLLITSAVNNKWPLFLCRAGKRLRGNVKAGTVQALTTEHWHRADHRYQQQSGGRHPPAGSCLCLHSCLSQSHKIKRYGFLRKCFCLSIYVTYNGYVKPNQNHVFMVMGNGNIVMWSLLHITILKLSYFIRHICFKCDYD